MHITFTHSGVIMQPLYDNKAPKKPTNVSVNKDLLAKARALNINLSATLETALVDLINARQRELWKQNNQSAIDAYNQLVEEHGTFGDDSRTF